MPRSDNTIEKTVSIHDLNELAALAQEIQQLLKYPSLILLSGSLGTGKTAFTKKLLTQFGYPENKVKSPTFSLFNQYQKEGILFAHLDLYRLDQHDQFLLEELLELTHLKKVVFLVEWPDNMKLEGLYHLVKQIITINIEFTENNFRKFYICVKNQ